jgi:putative salt-induced outer membrane protein YdiY
MLIAASLQAQEWLTDQSYRDSPEQLYLDQGLLYPPPPLIELPETSLPPSVFDQAPSNPQISGPIWYFPWTWFPWDGWENSAELGINGATGNTESLTVQSGARFRRRANGNLFDLRLLQNRTNNSGNIAQNNVLIYSDFERQIGGSQWNTFVKQGLEYDELRAFDLRYFINSGLGYTWLEREGLLFSSRFGAGASRDFGVIDERWVPEALFGVTYEHQVNANNRLVAKVDYFPAWEDFSSFRTITDLAWEYLLSEERNLSLKLGALHRHDSRPAGARPNDLNYSALLLYKF